MGGVDSFVYAFGGDRRGEEEEDEEEEDEVSWRHEGVRGGHFLTLKGGGGGIKKGRKIRDFIANVHLPGKCPGGRTSESKESLVECPPAVHCCFVSVMKGI